MFILMIPFKYLSAFIVTKVIINEIYIKYFFFFAEIYALNISSY